MRLLKFALGVVVGVLAMLAAAIWLLPERVTVVNERVKFENRIAIPPLLLPRDVNGEKVFDLSVQQGETEILRGRQTKTLGFSGTYLGPTLRARKGDKVRFNVSNSLDEPTTTHWHGMHLPAVMDGGPHQVIAPKETWQAHWTVTNDAATLWYHPHMMGATARQVYRGLAGLFVIDDDATDKLGLPAEYGLDDVPLIVQDRKFDDRAQFVYEEPSKDPPGWLDNPVGMLGDTILVNGTRAPFLEVPARLVRLRILNGSNARRFNFGFADNRPFHQIATDGGLLEHPVGRTRLLLAPGERAEILLDLSQVNERLTLMSYAVRDDVDRTTNFLQRVLASRSDENEEFRILEIRPRRMNGKSGVMPDRLATMPALDGSAAVTTRRVMLPTPVDETATVSDIERWEIVNASIAYHPFHIHGLQFRVLDRNGKPAPSYEQGWKDTLLVGPSETVRLIVAPTRPGGR